jgi:hypothetical protein
MFNNSSQNSSLARDEFSEFLKGFREYERSFLVKEKQDLFLDIYSEWLKSKEEKAKLRAIRLALELQLLGEYIDINRLFHQEIISP